MSKGFKMNEKGVMIKQVFYDTDSRMYKAVESGIENSLLRGLYGNLYWGLGGAIFHPLRHAIDEMRRTCK